MRKIEEFPPPININNNQFTFQQFIEFNILTDVKFGKDFQSLLICHQIKEALSQSVFQVSDDAWNLLVSFDPFCHLQ